MAEKIQIKSPPPGWSDAPKRPFSYTHDQKRRINEVLNPIGQRLTEMTIKKLERIAEQALRLQDYLNRAGSSKKRQQELAKAAALAEKLRDVLSGLGFVTAQELGCALVSIGKREPVEKMDRLIEDFRRLLNLDQVVATDTAAFISRHAVASQAEDPPQACSELDAASVDWESIETSRQSLEDAQWMIARIEMAAGLAHATILQTGGMVPVPPRPARRGQPEKLAAYYFVNQCAELFESMGAGKATRSVDWDTGKERGQFAEFVSVAIEPTILVTPPKSSARSVVNVEWLVRRVLEARRPSARREKSKI